MLLLPTLQMPFSDWLPAFNPLQLWNKQWTGLESDISKLLGPAYTFTQPTLWGQPNLVLLAAQNGTHPLDFSSLALRYGAAFLQALQGFVSTYGDVGKHCFNSVVSQHKISIDVNPYGLSGDAISASIRDGTLFIFVHPWWFGSDKCDPFCNITVNFLRGVIDACQAPGQLLGGLLLREHYAVVNVYEGQAVEMIRQALSNSLGMQVQLEPNWVQIYAELKPCGNAAVDHVALRAFRQFERVCRVLQDRAELASAAAQTQIRQTIYAGIFQLRIKPYDGSYPPRFVVIEDGRVFLQFSPLQFYDDIDERIIAAQILRQIL